MAGTDWVVVATIRHAGKLWKHKDEGNQLTPNAWLLD